MKRKANEMRFRTDGEMSNAIWNSLKTSKKKKRKSKRE